jgi:hypothetical protein
MEGFTVGAAVGGGVTTILSLLIRVAVLANPDAARAFSGGLFIPPLLLVLRRFLRFLRLLLLFFLFRVNFLLR